MYLDFAPLEGVTGAAFRRLHHEYFPGVDRYYAPFLSPTNDHKWTPREQREIFPEYNEGFQVIPQLLTKNAEDFLWAAQELYAMGYREINLNLGCPSGTVTAKGKGCGMLRDLEILAQFLDKIYDRAPCPVSIKTRLGMEQPEEFEKILSLFLKYPVSELIIHPRVRQDFYRHPVRTEAFERAYLQWDKPISFNGGIVSVQDYNACAEKFPKLQAIMIGQGLIADPFLAGKVKAGLKPDKLIIQEFLTRLLDAYTVQFQSKSNAIHRLKEVWIYLICSFDGGEAYVKRLRKAKQAQEFLNISDEIFAKLILLPHAKASW